MYVNSYAFLGNSTYPTTTSDYSTTVSGEQMSSTQSTRAENTQSTQSTENTESTQSQTIQNVTINSTQAVEATGTTILPTGDSTSADTAFGLNVNVIANVFCFIFFVLQQ